MKKSIRIVLFLSIYIVKTALLFSQENNGQINLSGLFNEYDHNPTTVSNRYTQLPQGLFSHTQIMNIPESNQAELLHKILIIVDSPLSYYLASERITVAPSSGSFTIPVSDHCILNAPGVEIDGQFLCPRGSSLEILNEGCQANCEE